MEPPESLSPTASPDEAEQASLDRRAESDDPYTVDKWKPKHNEVLALHLAGYKNKSIAALLDLHADYVSSIINDPRAQRAVSEMQHRQFKNIRMRLERRLARLGDAAVENLEETLTADIEAGTPAKKHQDKMSWRLFDEVFGEPDEDDTPGPTLSKDTEERIVQALEESEKIREAEEVEATVKEEANG